jgi:RNA polymerase sigma factor (TIGR02999 family)
MTDRPALTLLPEAGERAVDLGPIDDVVPMLLNELRALARRELGREHERHTLQTTELVHEAYLRLARDPAVTQRGRPYFYAAAGRAMRQVLVEAARRRNADKRGGGQQRVSVDEVAQATDAYGAELLALDEALAALARTYPRAARTVECRFFAGMNVADTAAALGVSARTVKADWALARAWLRESLADSPA